MTKITILGEDTQEKKDLKPIEFVSYITPNLNREDFTSLPKDRRHIVLISKCFTTDELDLIYAYDDDIHTGNLFLGLFNDGII